MAITVQILGEDVQLSGNPVEILCTGGSTPAGSKNYQILLKIISQDGKLENFPKTAVVTPNAAGEALFDISGYVDQPVKRKFQYPVSGATQSYPTEAFNIQVQAGETWMDEDGITQTTWGSISDVFQILKGGSPPRQLALWNDASTNFYQIYLQGGKWLTHRPWGDFVHPEQPVKLYFMVISNVSATYKVKAVYHDFSEEIYSTPVALDTDYLYEFNCNPVDLGINMENGAGNKIYFFDVWLESGGAAISESRRFHFDHKYCERPFFVLFANSIGGIDDVYFGGYTSEKFGMTSNTAFKRQTRDATVYDRTLVTTAKEGQNKWELNTGYKATGQILHLRDLILARDVWLLYPLLTPTNRIIIPVAVTGFDDVIIDRKKDIHSVTIEIEEAHSSQFNFDNRLY